MDPKLAESYLKKKGCCCPCCGSHELEGGPHEYEGDIIWQEVWCHTCGAEWNDIYNLTDVEIKEESKPEMGIAYMIEGVPVEIYGYGM